jgi:hypothetical protein
MQHDDEDSVEQLDDGDDADETTDDEGDVEGAA